MAPSKQKILAAFGGWVAVPLNVLPGLGAGYLYQRRWKGRYEHICTSHCLVRPPQSHTAKRIYRHILSSQSIAEQVLN